jgi:hypothetical protein
VVFKVTDLLDLPVSWFDFRRALVAEFTDGLVPVLLDDTAAATEGERWRRAKTTEGGASTVAEDRSRSEDDRRAAVARGKRGIVNFVVFADNPNVAVHVWRERSNAVGEDPEADRDRLRVRVFTRTSVDLLGPAEEEEDDENQNEEDLARARQRKAREDALLLYSRVVNCLCKCLLALL